MSGVSLRNLEKTFGSVHALDDVSLETAPGELIALLGPSGCGKTTLLRCVAGLERPDRGAIAIGGEDVTTTPARKRPIGMVFQSYVLFPNMTVRQNIGFPLKVRGATSQAIKKRTDELLELIGLTGEAERFPHQVSGGQQQRGALARALAPEPAVLLLDEPLSALDALVRTRLRDEIRHVQQMIKITALYVTHDQSEAMAIADRVAVMNQGKIEHLARPPDLYDGPATRFSAGFVGNRNAVELLVRDGEIALGKAFRTAAPAGSERVVAFFRPEDVRLSDNGGQEATVESVMFGGMLTRVYLRAATAPQAARLYADLPSRQALSLAPGATVRITIDPADIRVFPAE
ncbi:MAG TPA: ABC transporter ATP-binding protein [Thermomicrobiales bacterium]|nr:ABC transporter ATP-binding protein [Thermomicrobiales bacterium]